MTVPQEPTTTSDPSATPLPVVKPAKPAKPASTPAAAPTAPSFPIPPLTFQINTLTHPGSTTFLNNTTISTDFPAHITTVLTQLYLSPTETSTHLPPTKSVALILEAMPGVAYTIGTQNVDGAKEIHFSLDYISKIATNRSKDEISGVLVHELVHCFQYNGLNTCPSGLIEGIADWVRLRAGLAPPHWKRSTDGGWAAGYEKTGFFLEWLDQRKGGQGGVVRGMNEWLRGNRYVEAKFWKEVGGGDVGELWGEYVKFVAGGAE